MGSLQVLDSTFQNCSAGRYGGAIATSSTTSEIDIRRTIFVDNIAPQGGAIRIDRVSSVRIFACTFARNMIVDRDDLLLSAGSYNLTVESNYTDSVYIDPASTIKDLSICNNLELDDSAGCSSASADSPCVTFWGMPLLTILALVLAVI